MCQFEEPTSGGSLNLHPVVARRADVEVEPPVHVVMVNGAHARALHGPAGEAGAREFFTHVRFHQHEGERIVVHMLAELYARSAEEAAGVLEEAARGELAIASLAEEARPPAATGGDPSH